MWFCGFVCCFSSTVWLISSQFSNNVARGIGGVVYAYFSYVILSRSSFVNNRAINTDKIHQQIANSQRQTTTRSQLTQLKSRGGAVFLFGSDVHVDTCHFINNNASIGGAVYYETFTINDKTESFYSEPSASLVVTSTEFLNNSAQFGAGIYMSKASKLQITASNFKQNIAERDGAAV